VRETHCKILHPFFFILRQGQETAGRIPILKRIVVIAPKAGGPSSVALLCLCWRHVIDELFGKQFGLFAVPVISPIYSNPLMAIQQPDAEDGARDHSLAHILTRF
jgi:hypothetical protein